MKFKDAMMKIIRDFTGTPETNCQEIAKAIENHVPKPVQSFRMWTIPELNNQAQELTGQPMNTEMTDQVSELLYSDLRNSEAFTEANIDRLIVNTFDNRFSQISITPLDSNDPPNIVEAADAERFLAVGLLAESDPPKEQGDAEVIQDFGKDATAADDYAERISLQTSHQVDTQEPDCFQGPGMTQ